MSPPRGQKDPIVEPTPGDESNELTAAALRQRIRQQELLAELGVLALQRTSLNSMLDHTARATAEGLAAEYCKVMEYIPAEPTPGSRRRWLGRGCCWRSKCGG